MNILTALITLMPFLAPAKPVVITGNAGYYASWYEGLPMADREPYRWRNYTVANNDLPLGTKVRIKYTPPRGPARFAEAIVTDRGPAKRLVREKNRQFDFSYALFRNLENPKVGVISVEVEVLK